MTSITKQKKKKKVSDIQAKGTFDFILIHKNIFSDFKLMYLFTYFFIFFLGNLKKKVKHI